MQINWKRLNRKVHYWGALVAAAPVVIVICTGVLLLLKKDIHWIQPPTIAGQGDVPTLSLDALLAASKGVPEAAINSWADIGRVDLRPKKGVFKVRAKNSWEIQIDHQTGAVLHVAYRRSDLIESIHDGTFFHDGAKLWVFLPASIILLALWLTGIYLFLVPLLAKHKARKRRLGKDAEKMMAGDIVNQGLKKPRPERLKPRA